LANLDREAFGPDGWSEQTFEVLLRHPEVVGTLAQRSGVENAPDRLAGAIMVGSERGASDLRLAHVLTVGTAPDERGLGLGPALMSLGMATALSRDPDVFFLEVEVENKLGRALHAKMGFEVVSELPGIYEHTSTPGNDGLLMARSVAEVVASEVVPALKRASADARNFYGI
jgi:ribosomal protein S18 acetylase RimI-like enzyme